MAERINERLEAMVPELNDLEQKNIFNRAEIKKIVDKRRQFEYKLITQPSLHDYLSYIEYETALELCRRQRRHAIGWRKRTLSDHTANIQIISIYERAVAGQYKGDIKLWFQYIDFCLESGSAKHLQAVILKALRIHPMEERLWILAADRELRLGHLKGARTMLLRALRFRGKSEHLWEQYLRLECLLAHHVQKKASPSTQSSGLKGLPSNDENEKMREEVIEGQLPKAPEEELKENITEPNTPEQDPTKLLAAIFVILKQAVRQLSGEDTAVSSFLRFAWKLAHDLRSACGSDKESVHAWVELATRIRLAVDELLEHQQRGIWKLWWECTGPRDVQEQVDTVLNRASADDIIISWMNACPVLDSVVDKLAAHPKVRENPKAVVVLPLNRESAKECLQSSASSSSSGKKNLSVQVRLWSLKHPTEKIMLQTLDEISKEGGTVDLSAASAFLKALQPKSRLEGFLSIAILMKPSEAAILCEQVVAFQLALGMEEYEKCITLIAQKLRTDYRYVKNMDHLQAIRYSCLRLAGRIGSQNLNELYEETCLAENDDERKIDLWSRFEFYVQNQGGDASKIRWKATRAGCSPQEIIERLKEFEDETF